MRRRGDIVVLHDDGNGQALAIVDQSEPAAWKLSRTERKAAETQTKAVGRADLRLDPRADSLPLQQRRHRVLGSGLHYSGRFSVRPHRGQDQLECRQRRHSTEKLDGRHPLGTDLEGEGFMRIVCVSLLRLSAVVKL